VGLSRLWGLDIPPQALLEQAAKLGSDVAFFLYGGTALATGRGEKVTPLPRARCSWLVLLSPPTESIPTKTAKLYSQLEPSHFTSGQYTERLVDRLRATGDLQVPMLYNAFEQVAFTFFAGLSDYRTRLMQAGARRVHLAGSGPSLFVLVQNEIEGKAIVNTLGARGIAAFLACTVDAPLLPPLGDRPC
jgi:4-diphosphocytidyl-2-C-methyl-D-erythritol kinase